MANSKLLDAYNILCILYGNAFSLFQFLISMFIGELYMEKESLKRRADLFFVVGKFVYEKKISPLNRGYYVFIMICFMRGDTK